MWLAVEFVPARSAFLRSSFLVHHLPGLAFLPFLTKRPAPSEAEDAKGMCSQADAPAKERPVKPPYPAREPARKGVDDEQTGVDHHEDAGVDVEAFDGLHASPGPFVTLLLILHSWLLLRVGGHTHHVYPVSALSHVCNINRNGGGGARHHLGPTSQNSVRANCAEFTICALG